MRMTATEMDIDKVLELKAQRKVQIITPDKSGFNRVGSLGGSKRTKKSKKLRKKTRKHKGIIQTGGNKGRLKKGYRYSGKKLKSGLPQIVKALNM